MKNKMLTMKTTDDEKELFKKAAELLGYRSVSQMISMLVIDAYNKGVNNGEDRKEG